MHLAADDIRVRLLPWVSHLESRPVDTVTTVVLHATEEPTLQDARRIAEKSDKLVSGHYYVDRDGTIQLWVPIDRVAHHAAEHNRSSIGIEIVNLGRYPNHFSVAAQSPTEVFPEKQIQCVENLLSYLHREFSRLSDLFRHTDLDQRMVPASDNPSAMVRHRIDPGPMFPWERVKRFWSALA
jgi:N-acetylmuramoyl-L-alanine amidase